MKALMDILECIALLEVIMDMCCSKYVRWLEEVHTLVDPSRNMSRYRQHLATVSHDPPVIPIYPVLKKVRDIQLLHSCCFIHNLLHSNHC